VALKVAVLPAFVNCVWRDDRLSQSDFKVAPHRNFGGPNYAAALTAAVPSVILFPVLPAGNGFQPMTRLATVP
jgi:hypothetical protein